MQRRFACDSDAVKAVLGGEGRWHRLRTANVDTFVMSKEPVAAHTLATQVIGFDPPPDKKASLSSSR